MQRINRVYDGCLLLAANALLSISSGLQELAQIFIGTVERRQNRAGLRAGFDKTIKRY